MGLAPGSDSPSRLLEYQGGFAATIEEVYDLLEYGRASPAAC